MKTLAKVTKLKQKIKQLYGQIENIQTECTHPNVKKEYKASTGHYDPSCDKYWIEWDCPDCEKRWNTGQ